MQRRIIWCDPPPGPGKSWLYTLPTDCYDYGVYDVDKSASVAILNAYQKEGLVIWDLPKDYEYEEVEHALCTCMETFADFGR